MGKIIMSSENERLKKFFEDFSGLEYKDYTFTGYEYTKSRRFINLLSETNPNDIYITVFGMERCKPDKEPVEGRREMYGMHLIVNGEGYFETEKEKYKLKAGDIFFSFVGQHIKYYPDTVKPWTYIYLNFAGLLQDSATSLMGFDPEHCVRTVGLDSQVAKAYENCYNLALSAGVRSFETIGALYTLFGLLSKHDIKSGVATGKEGYIKQAISYIYNNLKNVTVQDIAENCAVSSSYLTRIFRQELGISLKECITVCRLCIVRNYLRNTKVPMSFICSEVGFSSAKYLKKVFRSMFGVTPTQYRRQIQGYANK